MVLSVDFFPGNNHIVATTLEGGINVLSVKDQLLTLKHESVDTHLKTNIAYCSHTVKNKAGKDAGVFLVGTENRAVDKFYFDGTSTKIEP